MNDNSIAARRITVGNFSLSIERIVPNYVNVRLAWLCVTLSKAEIFEIKRDLTQVLAELFPEGDEA